ncbi:unnamed protein product [Adineta steineri]|uniref:chitin synthase n=9 Tax=Bdelloidea TaxID=44578 RepID=A0A815CYU0_9BILA|nr:unnamed protein product [Adineta steineri]CAF1568471.1 unnamed protein product [Adineta steineri]
MVVKVGSGEIDDLSTLNVLDEESLLRELRARYKKGIIYTYIGDVLIAINPFKQLNIYEKQQHDLYKDVQSRNQLTPHIFWVADQAYRKLCLSKQTQCIAVSGESGAGKTESTKLMVSHIIHCSSDISDRELQNRIIETSPLLEAFGNAQTCMNQNSSRFGKYLQLNFTNTGRIVGAKVYDYLLEKSRVVQHGPGERTFHFFYYLFAGLEKEALEYFYLDDPETYRILKDPCGGKVFPSRTDFKHCRHMFNTQKDVMRRVGFTDEDINMVFTILSAILHLTNIRFSHDDETDGVYIEDEYPLEVVCTLLALDQEILTMALISTFSTTKGERVISLKNSDQANDCRDALAKALYERLFSWIVKQINTLLQPNRRHNQTDDNIYRTCSILDMSGFENFQVNSFEQLCINVANEHLQYYFNEHIFLQEEQDYRTESVSCEKVEFQNNEDLIELFMGTLGILALLDEESRFPKANDESLVQKFHSHCKNHPRYIKPRGNETAFGIHHYAGKVVYDARGFLEKNRDNLSANLIECMEKSGIELISYLFTVNDDTSSPPITLGSSASPSGNMNKLKSTTLHPMRRPKSFDIERTKENFSQKTAKSLRQESRPFKSNTIQKERFSQNTVTIHFRNSLAELLDKMKDAEPSFVRTSTLILNNETSYLSLLSNIQNTNSWQSIDDYTTIPKSYGIDDEQTGYCRLDRQGHWLLLSPPSLLLQKDTSQVVTYYDNRRLSRDSNIQQIEQLFHDSCESLTVSLDLHIPTDELLKDNDNIYGQNIVVWRNKIRPHQNISLDETRRISRLSHNVQLDSTDRCIKPNHGKVANQFDEELVQEQLRYNGILEISYIRNQGWPVRFTFEEFFKRYKFISYPQNSPIRINGITCERIFKDLSLTDYVIGKSKVFLKLEHLEILNQYYEKYISNIIKCQKVVKGFIVRRNLLRKAKQYANERHSLLTQVHINGKRTLEKLISLPKVSPKNIKQLSSKMENKNGRSGHFIKKKPKGQKKFTSDEPIQMNEQEHNEMLRVAKKLQLIDNDEFDGIDHRITSSKKPDYDMKITDDFRSSLEGLSEREVRILVQDEFTPLTNKHGQHKNFPMQANIQSGSGLASTTTSTPDSPLRVHEGVLAAMAAKIPIAPTMSLKTAEQLIRETKVAATSGDLFMTDWAVGQDEKKQAKGTRSKSEPRNILSDLHDENMLSEQKRDMIKKILMLQRQKFKDNQARKTLKPNEFENSIYSFGHMNQSSKIDDEQPLFEEDNSDCWDAARTMNVQEAYEKTIHCYRLSMRLLKIATYVVLNIGVLLTALVSKGALLLMTNSVAKVQETPYQERWVWMLLISVCAPYLFTFVDSLGKCLFGNKPWPTVKIFTVVFFIETLHSFGIAIFVFHILPKLDAARSLLIMNAVCLVPAFLKLFLTKSNSSIVRRSLLFLMDFFAFAMQCSCVGIALASKFLKNDASMTIQTTLSSLFLPTTTNPILLLNRHRRQDEFMSNGADLLGPDMIGNSESILFTTPISNMSSIDQNLQTILAGFHIEWELPVALILVSLAWWENFVDRDIKIGGRTLVHMKLLKENIIATRSKTSIIITCWKILVTILFAYIFHHGIFNTSVVFPTNSNTEQLEDPLPKLSSGQNSWAALGFDQQPSQGMFPILPPRERRSIVNTSLFMKRNKRQLDNDLPSNFAYDEDGLNSVGGGNNPGGGGEGRGEESNSKDRWIIYLTPMILKVISDALCFYMGRLACKLCMQRICFALPITLVTPLALTILLVMCSVAPKSTVFIENFLFWSCYADYAKESFKWQVICGLFLWWLSELWIGGHIWFGKSQRLAFTERLFVSPRYCATLLEQSLMMNRRRNERDELLTGTFDEMVTTNAETDFDEQSIEELSMEKKLSADVHTKIYSCATMWHETETEMLQLLKSIMRLDSDQCARRTARNYLHLKDLDYYEYEGHIFFDDATEEDDNNEQVPNRFVQQLLGVVDRAATAIHQCPMKIPPPFKTPTPYGGRLTWVLPGGNFLIAHIKDKTKIRHKKRWSQVMYMYYLLGYRLFGDLNIIEKLYKRKRKKNSSKSKSKLFKGFGNLLNNMDNKKRIQMENTYLLALDGDVDFHPEAVRLLVDRMKKNKKVGAACGRIHPIGSGPIVWYQKFEYAIGHWLQKATEHILGCVMCSPGCFSLFRGSALMDDHVLRTYCTKSIEARHYVQYDQGEDRWLCTLLLQEGYRVEYCAASDALTYAPESFHEFFNQRRRWVPSTIANIMDFLAEYKRIVIVNESISYLYIVYQLFLMVSTVLGPATVLLMIIGAFNACFGTSLWQSMYMSVLPAFFYLLLCFHTTTDFQIRAAAFFSAVYAIIMMSVIVGTTIQIAEDSWTSPNAVFLMLLFSINFIAALMHPQEFWCIVPGLLYFLCIPSGYLFLIIYSLCNLNIVSWGTREAPKKVKKNQSKEEIERARMQELTQVKKKSAGFFNQVFANFNFKKYDERVRSYARKWLGLERTGLNGILLKQILGAMERMEKCKFDEEMEAVATQGIYPTAGKTQVGSDTDAKYGLMQLAARAATPQTTGGLMNRASYPQIDPQQQLIYRGINNARNTPYGQIMSYAGISRPIESPQVVKRDELVNPAWIFHESLLDSEVVMLDPREVKFFKELIERYLYPLVEDKDHQKKMVSDLKSLRNNCCFVFFMINTLWIVIIFSFQLVSERIRDYVFIPIKRLHNEPLRFEPLGFGFLVFFASILLVQFISMLWHRYGTLLHLLASTDLKLGRRTHGKNGNSHRREDFTIDNVEDAVEQVKVLQQLKGFDEEDLPEPDYDVDIDDDDKQATEPDLSTTGLVYRTNGPRFIKNSTCTSQQWSDIAKVNDMQRNLDTTDHSEISQMAGYVSGSVKTYGSNYEAIKRRQISNKRHLYNKSLDHVFKSRYHALTQQQHHQTHKNPRVKLTDVFQQQQQQLVSPRARRTSSALTVRDSVNGVNNQQSAITKKHRRKFKERHLEHL